MSHSSSVRNANSKARERTTRWMPVPASFSLITDTSTKICRRGLSDVELDVLSCLLRRSLVTRLLSGTLLRACSIRSGSRSKKGRLFDGSRKRRNLGKRIVLRSNRKKADKTTREFDSLHKHVLTRLQPESILLGSVEAGRRASTGDLRNFQNDSCQGPLAGPTWSGDT